MPHHLTFTLHERLSASERQALLDALATEPGVGQITMIDPGSPVPEIRNMGVLELTSGADAERLLTKLQHLTDTLSAARSPARKLVRNARPKEED